ncbi:hypothetical protein IFU04_25110 [Pseudomonas syringae]|nr:hypothetical protein [Pseudomonas syringae]
MLKHGEYIAPHISALELENSPPNEVDPSTLSGVVTRFDKRISVSIYPSALNSLGGIYRNALYVRSGGASTQLRGLILFFSIMVLSPFFVFHRVIIDMHVTAIKQLIFMGCCYFLLLGICWFSCLPSQYWHAF